MPLHGAQSVDSPAAVIVTHPKVAGGWTEGGKSPTDLHALARAECYLRGTRHGGRLNVGKRLGGVK